MTASATAHRPHPWLRVGAVVAVLMVLGVLLAPAVRTWLAQQHKIQALERDVTNQRIRIGGLKQQQSAWKDPAYVKAQARDRLKFVLPGETGFTTIDGSGAVPKPAAAPTGRTDPTGLSGLAGPRSVPWFGLVWRSVAGAGGVND